MIMIISFTVTVLTMTKESVKAADLEAEWFHKCHVSPFDAICGKGSISSAYGSLMASSFLGIGSAGTNAFEWLKNSKILNASQANMIKISAIDITVIQVTELDTYT
ncbi:5-epiaristolochene synthase-like [Tripterygium wilfordii]|uniref:5-epiaristolochene synthase-like n=1 Tax=Tripterygium wilfordii TaxID=458696 RepID=UPI0018F7F632|nr:5-epiaristolochene synthase-like [Tripterygium wilfordii]